jgi:hypothetical protein
MPLKKCKYDKELAKRRREEQEDRGLGMYHGPETGRSLMGGETGHRIYS